MRIGIRQKLIIVIFSGLFAAMGMIGTYRYVQEKQDILRSARVHAEQTGRLMADFAAQFILTADSGGLHYLAKNFMQNPDAQEIAVTDKEGRRVVQMARPDLAEKRIMAGPFPVMLEKDNLGDVRIAVYPADMDARLRAYATGAVVEHLFIFLILAAILSMSVTIIVTSPVKELAAALKDVIDQKDFTRRVKSGRRDELGALAGGVNYLLERLEQIIIGMGGISSRINELSPRIAEDTRDIRKNSEVEAGAIVNVSAAVEEITASIRSVAEGAESLSVSAAEASSAVLEMNASNQEVARHANELTGSVEDVTTSVMEMIASIREVAGHAEALSSAAEETSASATQIEVSVREVEQAAKESARLSKQVSAEAKDIGAASIQDTILAMDKIKDAVSRYSDTVTRLGKRSEEIGKILGVIVEVTERTNLLALNAAILAAQAGEHGRGFAVVAEEIKALAERTAASAQEISKLIAAVQKETRDAVTGMAESLIAVDTGVGRSKAAGAALDKILMSSGRSAETANMIERAMAEQARGAKQVNEAITNVKQMTAQIASATQAQSKGTEMILHSAEGMRDIARRVNTALAEQGRGGKQIAEAAENVAGRAGQIALAIKEQRESSRQIMEAITNIRDLPRQNMKRMEGMTAPLKTLGEQAELLQQELSTMIVGKGAHGAHGNVLRMGVIPLEAPAEMHKRFTPLAEYLSAAVGKRVELSLSVDFEQTLKDLEDGTTELAFLTPTTYIDAGKRFGAKLLVKALRKGAPYSHAVIVTRAGSGLGRVEDVYGKRFAFGDRMSTSSYLMPLYMLTEAGVRLDDLKEHGFLGHHDDVAKAVLIGEYDAGGLRETTAEKFKDQGLVVLQRSTAIPEFNFCASKNLDTQLIGQVKKALIALDPANKEHGRVLSLIDQDYTGFTAARDSDYDGIRDVMKKMGT